MDSGDQHQDWREKEEIGDGQQDLESREAGVAGDEDAEPLFPEGVEAGHLPAGAVVDEREGGDIEEGEEQEKAKTTKREPEVAVQTASGTPRDIDLGNQETGDDDERGGQERQVLEGKGAITGVIQAVIDDHEEDEHPLCVIERGNAGRPQRAFGAHDVSGGNADHG